VAGGNGSSPFDTIAPWSGMVRETVDGNAMVKIPKFYYKWTDDSGSLKLQISPTQQTGFHVSPAHADRGDGKGEREYVYVGRYHCGSDYTSKTGVMPINNITRVTARTGCTGVGTGYYMYDYAMYWTIMMLYLVEYANWDVQVAIGFGRGNGSSAQNVGASDTMTYHTGTMQADRSIYGVGCQYRHIEGLWDNVANWVDGIRFDEFTLYVNNNPTSYSDTSGGTQVFVGSSMGACISDFNVPTITGYEWALYPKSTVNNSQYNTYVADVVYLYKAWVGVYVGGFYYQGRDGGLFYSNGYAVGSTRDAVGARLQYLP
jgi:hypothetical protein